MKSLQKQKKNLVAYLAIFAMLVFAVIVFFMPIEFASADNDFWTEFEEFQSSINDMRDMYEQSSISAFSLDGEKEEDYGQNRLILTSTKAVDDCGAVLSSKFKDYYVFQYQDAESAKNAFSYFDSLPEVTSLSYDYEVSVEGQVSNEVQVSASYSYNSWGAPYVGYSTYVSTMLDGCEVSNLNKVVVAVLDSGINTSHELLQGRIMHQYARDFTRNFDGSTKYTYEDFHGHGTHVSGTIVEATLSNVMILPLKVLTKDGTGSVIAIISAVEYAYGIKNELKSKGFDLKIMNMSIGVDNSAASGEVRLAAKQQTLTQAVHSAYSAGVISIVAAGNECQNTSHSLLANIDEAIVVSAVKKTFVFPYAEDKLIFDGNASNYGYSNYGETVDFAAPGTYIKSSYIGASNAYKELAGTSMATPHVTACVALIYSNPSYTNLDFPGLNKLLQQHADRSNLVSTGTYALGSATKNVYYGYGLINIAGIGTIVEGEVEFSETEINHSSNFQLSLSYNCTLKEGETLQIYYTRSETAKTVNKNDGIIFSSPIIIDKTTKITATAFVYDSDGSLVRRSRDTSKTFYFNYTDLESMYEIVNGTLLSYKGKELTTLNVPESLQITTVGKGAFNNSAVQELSLPNTVTLISESAFDGNTKLTEISCLSSNLTLSNKAFYSCKNLETVNFSNITKIGDLAFAYTKIGSLVIPQTTQIGLNAFSSSALTKLVVGKDITSFGSQTELNPNLIIYGYSSTQAEDVAIKNKVKFVDLSLTIGDFASHKIIKESDSLDVSVRAFGFDVAAQVNFSGAGNLIEQTEQSVGEFEKEISLHLQNLPQGEYSLSVQFTDRFGTVLSTQTMKLEVVDDNADTFTVNFDAAHFNLYVDDEIIQNGTLLFKGHNYNLKFVAVNGYDITSVKINNVTYPIGAAFLLTNVQEDLNVDVQTVVQSNLTISFLTHDCGLVKINGEVLTGNVAHPSRNSSLVFEVEANVGYYLLTVLLDGQTLVADENGRYHIDDISTNQEVDLQFQQAEWDITLSYVNASGACVVTPSDTNLKNIAHGSKREFTVIAKDGFTLDFVSVNGEKIDVVNNSFVIDGIDSDKDIVISFKSTSNSIFASENKVIFYYFMVFFALFVIFVIARIALHVIKKKKAEN